MTNVKQVLKVGENITVLVCDMFSDEEITRQVKTSAGIHSRFEVENPKFCFSNPTTRNVVLFGSDDFSSVESIEFV